MQHRGIRCHLKPHHFYHLDCIYFCYLDLPHRCHLDRRERSQYAGKYHLCKGISAVDGDREVDNFK
jgi:hypothetical protein